MSYWRQLLRGLRGLVNRKAAERDIADEVQNYLDQAVADLVARGRSPKEARRLARLEYGSAGAVREEVRAAGWENAVLTSCSDLRYAARRLRGSPGFTMICILTLALGIGATTAIFSVIEGVLLKPLPYPNSERLVALWHAAPGIQIQNLNLAPSLYFTYRDESRVFEDLAMWTTGGWDVTGIGEPEHLKGLSVTNSFLPLLGVQPVIGRRFAESDDDTHSQRTVMLSASYWKSHFGGEPSVLGRRMLLDGNAHQVIGVLPPSFQFLDHEVSLVVPMRSNRAEIRLVGFCCQGFARLKPGVTLAHASADVARMIPMAPEKFPLNPGLSLTMFTSARVGPNLRFLKDQLLGDIGNTLWVVMGTVAIVLLIACANVANLLLVRADGRRQELAVRAALGAGSGRLARELLLESGLLGLAGGALGLTLAWAALRMLAASRIPNLPRLHEIAIDPVVLAFTLAVSLGAGMVFGLMPVLKYARPQLAGGLRSGARGGGLSRERSRARSLLVAVQVALALVLLIDAGLMIRTFQALRRVDPGISGAAQMQTFSIYIPEKQVKDPELVIRMEEDLVHGFESISGVTAVAFGSAIPLESSGSSNPIFSEDHPPRDGEIATIRRFRFISPGYIHTIGSRLVAGRDLTWAGLYKQAPEVLISENMARDMFHDPRAALGKRIRSTVKDDWREIVGVVADVRDDGLNQKAPGFVYWPLWQKNAGFSFSRGAAYIIRTPRAGSTALIQEIRQVLASVNPNLPMANVETMDVVYDRSLARVSFTLVLLAIAGGMALLLGVVGIYGVISYTVSQRTREISIRIALGAPLAEVTGLFVRNGLLMSGVGAVFGLLAALALTRLMKSLLYEVSTVDPLTFSGACAALILAAILGSYLPARRATRVDPVDALRAD